MNDSEPIKILFFTDIHQNIDGIKKLNFSGYDAVLCSGDLLNPSDPDIDLAKDIIDLLPENMYIVPGNCDRDDSLIEYMKNKLKFIHKESVCLKNIPILGIGYSRNLKDDMKIYRTYFREDENRIFSFINNNSHNSFIIDFCGIKINPDNSILFLSEEEAYEGAKNFINKFVSFSEDEITKLFSEIETLEGGIILTHSPPYGALDKLDGLPNVGSTSIDNGIKKTHPALILCGHFHELYGKTVINDSIIFNPGAIKDNRYGIIEIINKEIKTEFKKL